MQVEIPISSTHELLDALVTLERVAKLVGRRSVQYARFGRTLDRWAQADIQGGEQNLVAAKEQLEFVRDVNALVRLLRPLRNASIL